MDYRSVSNVLLSVYSNFNQVRVSKEFMFVKKCTKIFSIKIRRDKHKKFARVTEEKIMVKMI